MIQTVDNYYISLLEQKSKEEIENVHGYYACYDKFNKTEKSKIENLSITLEDYQDEKYTNNIFFSFFRDEEKRILKNEDDLIIAIKKDIEGKYLAQTGNYVGSFKWNGLEIDIKSRFSNIFLERMLNFANDVFLDDVTVSGDMSKDDFVISRYIIYYMFTQSLEKAFLLGLPKAYKSIKYHDMKLKGKVDINGFIKYDIPFQGKVSSVSREQKEIQEIIDVLYKAVNIIDKNKFSTKNISHIKTHLKQNKSNRYISNQTLDKALKSKALQNPIFKPYKKVLEYAKYIIQSDSIKENKSSANDTYGFIINIAELFEIYVSKLLQKEFPTWKVESPKIDLYNTPYMFYTRKIIPDIVMTQNSDVLVFDTKYKRMDMKGKNQYGAGDVDRNDFFQINAYLSYYQNENYHVVAGGLLYPMDNFKQSQCHSDSWFSQKNTSFIVDGIDLSPLKKDLTLQEAKTLLLSSEKSFIARIKNIINMDQIQI